MRDRELGIEVAATVGERVGRDVHDTHHRAARQRPYGEGGGHAAQISQRRDRLRAPIQARATPNPSSAIASERVAGESLNRPRTAEVTVRDPGLRTPRIDMQRCSASIITNAPRGLQSLDERVGDLRRQPLLHLRALREPVDETRELRQAR